MANKELKFTDNLKQCVSDGNTRAKEVEVFLVNGVRLTGNVAFASDNIVIIGSKAKGYSNINPAAIPTYMIEPPKKEINYNR